MGTAQGYMNKLNQHLDKFDPEKKNDQGAYVYNPVIRAQMCNCELFDRTIGAVDDKGKIIVTEENFQVCTKELRSKGVHPTRVNVDASSWPMAPDEPAGYPFFTWATTNSKSNSRNVTR
jgi:hypothetical protein